MDISPGQVSFGFRPAGGEIPARDVCRREGIRLNVYRPSIVLL